MLREVAGSHRMRIVRAILRRVGTFFISSPRIAEFSCMVLTNREFLNMLDFDDCEECMRNQPQHREVQIMTAGRNKS
jgi:hypothetical protein